MSEQPDIYTRIPGVGVWGDYHFVSEPELSEWSACFGNLTWTPEKGVEPNWFWRQMQFLCFGIKWKKVL